MAETYLIGVDLGTMGTKAAIFDTEGNLVALAFRSRNSTTPDQAGWSRSQTISTLPQSAPSKNAWRKAE